MAALSLNTDRQGMGLTGLRRFTWALLLVLLSGLATPAFTCKPNAGATLVQAKPIQASHVHAGLVRRDPNANPTEASRHCPGCPATAECAISCLDMGLLPASIPVQGSTAQEAWTAFTMPSLVGTVPLGDVEPPGPVL